MRSIDSRAGTSGPRAAVREFRLRHATGLVTVALLAPAFTALVLLRLLPAGQAMLDAFRTPDGEWGLENLADTIATPAFQNSLRVTLLFSLVLNPLEIVIALALALLFNQRIVGNSIWRALVFIPVVIPQTVSAVIWGMAMRPDGPINALLRPLGFNSQFLTSPDTALFSLMVIIGWIGIGYWMVFLLAGLKEIPDSLHEAAALDGAGILRRFWSITLPMMKRPLLFVLVADTATNFLVFAPIRVLTRGGPAGSTNLVMHHIFDAGYSRGDIHTANTVTFLLVVVVLAIVALQFRMMKADGAR